MYTNEHNEWSFLLSVFNFILYFIFCDISQLYEGSGSEGNSNYFLNQSFKVDGIEKQAVASIGVYWIFCNF